MAIDQETVVHAPVPEAYDELGRAEESSLQLLTDSQRCTQHYTFPLALIAVVCVTGFWRLLDPVHRHTITATDTISLIEFPATHPGCENLGVFCMCDVNYKCKSWNFEVGDVIIFGTGRDTLALAGFNFLARSFLHGAVHAAIVTDVRGQRPGDIIVTEALADQKQRVVQGNASAIFTHRTYHDVWIRRVDAIRFPLFTSRSLDIAHWANQHAGDPFDSAMMYPGVRNIDDSDNYIQPEPDCAKRQAALQMFQAGGPRKWMCSQFVAWILAFAGGLNTDYPDGGSCPVPKWDGKVENLQPSPGDLLQQPYWDAHDFHIVCANQWTTNGCSVGFAY